MNPTTPPAKPPTKQARLITDHRCNGLNDALNIVVLDEPSDTGANHAYLLDIVGGAPGSGGGSTVIRFQNGPILEAGFNGLSNEALIAVVIDRLRGFQGENPRPERKVIGDASVVVEAMNREELWGKFKCRDNAIAITHLEDALMRLQKRTRDRMARGVEGTLQR